ncbi:MAG TPA: hypothetical protein VLE02_01385 [Nitrosarchaeum sp.]|nr:hypothetical protein [Nitrosarchaeum sp.]
MKVIKPYLICSTIFGLSVWFSNSYVCMRDNFPGKIKWNPINCGHFLTLCVGSVTYGFIKGTAYSVTFPISAIFTGRRFYKWYLTSDGGWMRPTYTALDCISSNDKYSNWDELWN